MMHGYQQIWEREQLDMISGGNFSFPAGYARNSDKVLVDARIAG
jgi:hypothetical protein